MVKAGNDSICVQNRNVVTNSETDQRKKTMQGDVLVRLDTKKPSVKAKLEEII